MVKATMKFVSVSIFLYLLLIQNVSAQENLAVNQPVSRNIAAGATDKFSIYLQAGPFEVDKEGTGGNILETNRSLRDVLIAKGYDVRYQQFAGWHDALSWRGTFADGLIALLGRIEK